MVPDGRKGKLRLCKDTDGLTHLQWGTRAADMPFTPEDDFLVFPQEAQMKFIPKPGVFVIKFPEDASRNMFFWSQQPELGDEEELTTDLNAALNGEAPEAATRRSDPVAQRAQAIRAAQAAAASALTGTGTEETPATTAAVAATPAAPAKAPAPVPQAAREDTPSVVSSDALRAALGGLGGAPSSVSARGMDAAAMASMLAGMQQGGEGVPQQRQPRGPGLADILTPETVGPLLRDEDVRNRLLEFLPEENRATQNLEELLRTPQFQSQLERFSAALQSGQMDLTQFGLSPGTGFSVQEFLSAIQAKHAGDAKGEGDKEMGE